MRHFLWTVLLLPLMLQAQQTDTVQKYLDEDLALVNRKNAVYGAVTIRENDHWMLYAVYPENTPLLRCYFKDRALTVKDGPFRMYHPGNQTAVEGYYIDNIQMGVWRYYYPNGRLKDSGMIKNNRMAGKWTGWYEDGKLRYSGSFPDPDSIIAAMGIPYSPFRLRGILARDTTVSLRNGIWTGFYPDGEQSETGTYYRGEKNGAFRYSYPGGQTESQGNYQMGSQEGTWEYFRENGKRSTIEEYQKNKIVRLRCFDEAGEASGDYCSILKPAVPVLELYVDFRTYMLDHLFWPKELDGKDVNGVVKLQYTISKEGQLSDLKILKSPHELISKEVERFFRSLEKWSPAVSHNRAIDYTTELEIPFYR